MNYNAVPSDLPPPPVATPEERDAYLSQAITRAVGAGWRVESRTSTQAVLVKGKQTAHVLHLLLSFLTFGLWLFVWPFVHERNRRRVQTLTVDQYGQVFAQLFQGYNL